MAINLRTSDTEWKTPFVSGFHTPRLTVKPLEKRGRPALLNLLAHPDMYRFVPDLRDKGEAVSWLDRVFASRNYLFLEAETVDARDFAGFILFNRHPDNRIVLGGAIRKDQWGKGYAGEILVGLRLLLEETGCTAPVYADVLPSNVPVIKALEKAGFIRVLPDSSEDSTVYRLHLERGGQD
jgi:RimJ/RimL family protein N-acetyltransferase